jgi:methylthioribose-1-phosphate isomerase
MMEQVPLPPPILWSDDGVLKLLDQRQLPHHEAYVVCRNSEDVRAAIAALVVRGAPAIGLAGAYGVALAACASSTDANALTAAAASLATARPTARNIARAVRAVLEAALAAAPSDRPAAALAMARTLHQREHVVCNAIATAGAALVPNGAWVLTHCHTGALATGGGLGTALGALAVAWRQGRLAGVYACETRPLWQGARLTAWECSRLGIPCRLIVDGAAGLVLASGRCAAVFVGADRIAANGDVANKIGTYPLAVLAQRHALPFVVLAPWDSIDPSLPSGAAIPLEERSAQEVASPAAAATVPCFNPAFDVTPGSLVTALVTEHGLYRRPYALDREAPAQEG